jgi:RNA polymerase sigma-70 factor (ECF subfamily)
VWGCLQRFGIRHPHLDDTSQEVFVVVQQRLGSFRGEARLTTWLYSICLRVAAAYRRKHSRRREVQIDEWPETARLELSDPEQGLSLRERRRVLDAILDELDLEKRGLLVMYEVDEMTSEEIAAILGVPIGTVYSRLHAARKAFEKAVLRFRARRGRGVRS